jgi:hypothetical protein
VFISKRVEDYAAEQLSRQVEAVAVELERLAGRVRDMAAGIDRVGELDGTHYAYVAGRVQHAVISALPCLGLNDLTRTAAEADDARAKGA